MNAKWGMLTESGVSALIVDILETHLTREFTYDQIVEEVRRCRPDTSTNTIYIATNRLSRRGKIEKRFRPNDRLAYFSLSHRSYLRGDVG